MRLNSEDTIAAIATAAGVAGVGIIRISGNAALAIADPIVKLSGGGSLARAESHRLLHGWVHQEGEPIDEVMAVVMLGPRSYTREDVVEIHCHGGPTVLHTVLEMVCVAGARLAQPGEFTMRAFLNGRIDLTQVEAVADICRASSQVGLRVSANQLRGRLYDAIHELQAQLAEVAALVEAGIDFPEEDVVFARREEIIARVEEGRKKLTDMLEMADRGRRLREGLAVAIAGRPNVGKSSLLNALLRENRAIVAEVPGTTRDTLEESTEISGILLRLTDTAGIREETGLVEMEGIDRAKKAMAEAELVLLVLDGSAPLEAGDLALLQDLEPESLLVAVNKRDLMASAAPLWEEQLGDRSWIGISALTGEGLDDLGDLIAHWALRDDRPLTESALITNLRQKQAATRALEALDSAQAALEQGIGDELLAVDLSNALLALGDIVGETTADDLLNRIFSEFCIGK